MDRQLRCTKIEESESGHKIFSVKWQLHSVKEEFLRMKNKPQRTLREDAETAEINLYSTLRPLSIFLHILCG